MLGVSIQHDVVPHSKTLPPHAIIYNNNKAEGESGRLWHVIVPRVDMFFRSGNGYAHTCNDMYAMECLGVYSREIREDEMGIGLP